MADTPQGGFLRDEDGALVVAGPDGTPASAGRMLQSAQNIGPNIAVPAGGASSTPITGLAFGLATGDRPVLLRAFLPSIIVATLAAVALVNIEEDAVAVAQNPSAQAYAAARGVGAVLVEHLIPAGTPEKSYAVATYGANASAHTVVLSTLCRGRFYAIEV